MIRAALDAHVVGRRGTGNETYMVSLADALSDHPDVHPIVLLDRGATWPTNGRHEAHRLRMKSRLLRVPIELPLAARRLRADLLHVQYVAPPIAAVPVVAAIHDLSFEDVPDIFPRSTELRLKLSVRATARRARTIVAISEFTRQRLIERYHLDPNRVFTTPVAISSYWRPTDAAEQAQVLVKLGIQGPFVLAVGNVHPRKNLPRLIRAAALLRSDGFRDIRLVLVGSPQWRSTDVNRLVESIRGGDWITQTGFVDDRTLRALYGSAIAVAHVSLYEGFGLPVLEAMSCGAVVVASSTTAIPEAAGGAGILVDPEDDEAVADGLRRALTDSQLRRTLADDGPRHAASFTAKRFADATVQAYRAALE